MKKCMEFRVEGRRTRRTWLQSVEADMAEFEIDKEDVHDRKKWREKCPGLLCLLMYVNTVHSEFFKKYIILCMYIRLMFISTFICVTLHSCDSISISSVDPNKQDSHVYNLISRAG